MIKAPLISRLTLLTFGSKKTCMQSMRVLKNYYVSIIIFIFACLLVNLFLSFLSKPNKLYMYYSDNSEKIELNNFYNVIKPLNKERKQIESDLAILKKDLAKVSFKNLSQNYCPIIPNTCQGSIDVKKVIKDAALDKYVEFFENFSDIKLKEKNQDKFYLSRSRGLVNINRINTESFNISNLINIDVELGGRWKPKNCTSRFNTAIIIPSLNRNEHTLVVTQYLNMLLQRQQINYRIFVVEPFYPNNSTFNKGILYNIGYKEVLKLEPMVECFILHDVDLLPEDDRNIYTCSNNPRHLSVAVDKFNYELPYKYLVGGVLAIKKEQYLLINGYRNDFWGWGGEDDDFYQRMKMKKLVVERPPASLARFRMLRHTLQDLNKERIKLLKSSRKLSKLNGLNSLKYKKVKIKFYKAFTHFLVEFDKS